MADYIELPDFPIRFWAVGPDYRMRELINFLATHPQAKYAVDLARGERAARGKLISLRWTDGDDPQLFTGSYQEPYIRFQIEHDVAVHDGEQQLKKIYREAAQRKKAQREIQGVLFDDVPKVPRRYSRLTERGPICCAGCWWY